MLSGYIRGSVQLTESSLAKTLHTKLRQETNDSVYFDFEVG